MSSYFSYAEPRQHASSAGGDEDVGPRSIETPAGVAPTLRSFAPRGYSQRYLESLPLGPRPSAIDDPAFVGMSVLVAVIAAILGFGLASAAGAPRLPDTPPLLASPPAPEAISSPLLASSIRVETPVATERTAPAAPIQLIDAERAAPVTAPRLFDNEDVAWSIEDSGFGERSSLERKRVQTETPKISPPPGLLPDAPSNSGVDREALQPLEPSALPPWRRFAAPPPENADGKPLLAIVIDDLGADDAIADRLLAIDAPITLAILPYVEGAAALAERARAADREVLLHLPMQPVGPENPGPDPISPRVSTKENLRRLEKHLAAFEGYVGVNNHMGSAATADRDVISPVLEQLRERGLLFLDSRTAQNSWGWRLAQGMAMPAASNAIFLDNHRSENAVRARLDQAADIARRNGAAVAIGPPHRATLSALESWIAADGAGDVILTPVTAVVARGMGW